MTTARGNHRELFVLYLLIEHEELNDSLDKEHKHKELSAADSKTNLHLVLMSTNAFSLVRLVM